MALDTTIGGADADSYDTLAAFKAWADARSWTYGDDAALEVNMRRAVDYLEANYSFIGDRVSAAQALAWPRINGTVEGYSLQADEIPPKVIKAQRVLANLLNSGEEIFATVSGGAVIKQRDKVGPIETETEYNENTQRTQPKFPELDGLLAGYTTASRSETWGNGRVRLG